MAFESITDTKRLLKGPQYFKMSEGEKMTFMLPKSWKNLFNIGIIITVKMRCCDECKGEILFMTCNKQVTDNKKFEANLNLVKKSSSLPFWS